MYIDSWLLFGIALHIVFALFQSFKDERATTIPIVITIEMEITKRSKETIPKIKQTRVRSITLQGAIKKSFIIITLKKNYSTKYFFGISGVPMIFLPSVHTQPPIPPARHPSTVSKNIICAQKMQNIF